MFIFDLDETIYIGDLVKKAAENIGINDNSISGSTIDNVLLDGYDEKIKKELIKLFKDPLEGALNKYPINGTRCLLKVIKGISNSINYNQEYIIGITSRPQNLIEVTKYCIWRDFGDLIFDNIYFPNDSNEINYVSKKGAIEAAISKYGQDSTSFYFDDNINHCKEALGCGVKNVHLIQNSHTGWNNNIEIPTNIKPIKSILEIEKLYYKELFCISY